MFHIKNIRYADDTVIMASSFEDLQSLLQKMHDIFEECGPKLNVKSSGCAVVNHEYQ